MFECRNVFKRKKKTNGAEFLAFFQKIFSRFFKMADTKQYIPIKVDLMSTYKLILSINQFSWVFLSQTMHTFARKKKLKPELHYYNLTVNVWSIELSSGQVFDSLLYQVNRFKQIKQCFIQVILYKMEHFATKQQPAYILQIQMILST